VNRYGQMALEFNLRHRPEAVSLIQAPDTFFAKEGETIAAEVTRLRDEILGQIRPGESPEAYRLRGYRALATAEELTFAHHHLFQPETDRGEDDTTNDLDRYSVNLSLVNQAVNAPL
jgi:hypothetical protein